MITRNKFFGIFDSVCREFGKNVSVFYVSDLNNTYGLIYCELNKVSNELCEYFSKILNKDFQYIAVSLSDYFFLPFIILGIWKYKCAFAGIENQYTLSSNLYFLNFLRIKYIITDNDVQKYGGTVFSVFFILGRKFFIFRREVSENKLSHVEDMCYGIMTSGSTGPPKIIQVPWSCILSNVIELLEIFEITESDCVFQASPCTFDPFFVELLLSFLKGCSLTIVSNEIKLCTNLLCKALFQRNKIKTTSVLKNNCTEKYNFSCDMHPVQEQNVTVLQMTPSIFKRWNNMDIQNIILAANTSLRILVLGGEKFPNEILRLKSYCNKTKIFNIYGITEISCWAFLNEVTSYSINAKVSLGKPLKDIKFKFSPSGELCIGSQTRVCIVDEENYLSLHDEPVFRNSGDIVDKINNELFFNIRSNQIVKKFGIKIDLRKIEELFLKENPLINECHCLFDESILKIGLFYVPTAKGTKKKYLILTPIEFCQRHFLIPEVDLADVEKPDYFIEMPNIPLNLHGKCDKEKLKIFLKNCSVEKATNIDLSNIFSKLWGDVLGLKKSHLFSKTFKELGGNSVLALDIVNKLLDYGVEVPQNFLVELLGVGSYESCLKILSCNCRNSESPMKKRKIDIDVSFNLDVEILVKWKYDLKKCVDATPTVFTYQGKGRLIVGSHSCKLSCLDLESGCEIWTLSLGDRIESGFTIDKEETRGFVGCYDGCVYCIDVSNGSLIWKHATEEMIKSTPCLSSNGRIIYVGSYDKQLYCLSVIDGALVSKIKLSEGGIYSSGKVSDSLNMFFIGTLDGTCIAFNQEKYQLVWKTKLKTPVFSSPCLINQDSKIIFAEVLGVVHCFNSLNGALMWVFEAGGNIYSSLIVQESNSIAYLIFGCHDCHVYCLKCEVHPELKWKQKLDSSVFARPTTLTTDPSLGDCSVCAATTKGFVYLCKFTSGNVINQIKLDGEVFSSPVTKKNEIFIGCRDNNVYSLKINKLSN